MSLSCYLTWFQRRALSTFRLDKCPQVVLPLFHSPLPCPSRGLFFFCRIDFPKLFNLFHVRRTTPLPVLVLQWPTHHTMNSNLIFPHKIHLSGSINSTVKARLTGNQSIDGVIIFNNYTVQYTVYLLHNDKLKREKLFQFIWHPYESYVAPFIPRLPSLPVLAGCIHPPGRGGRQRGALLVLLVTRLVPVACQHLSLLALLQLVLRLLPALHTQLHPQQGPPSCQSHPTHTSQRDLDRCSSHHQQHGWKCCHVSCLEKCSSVYRACFYWAVIRAEHEKYLRQCNMIKSLFSAGWTDEVQYTTGAELNRSG